MANYYTHTYTTEVYGTLTLTKEPDVEDDSLQWEVSVTVICTSPYVPAKIHGPPEFCYPAEGPEFEFDEFEVFVGKTTILKSADWTVAEALFGKNIWAHLYDDAVTDAEENSPEEGDER